ncbi:MAG: P1 family peptidase [Bradyrhizobiaceae bacterium]|nr:P1 family peptidase [Bradyrhizobiaceae bacterium]
MKNLITDVPGIAVGHATDARLGSGVTAIVFDKPAVAAADMRGGGTGTRETELLNPIGTVERIDAIALAGGSAFGLEAGAGVAACLAEQGRGFAVGNVRVPIAPTAILFDLLGPGDKEWGRYPPYRELGHAAAASATADFALGSVGAGTGATTENLKGGIGSASATAPTGHVVGALAAVNAVGRVTVGGGPHFWAALFEVDKEFGGRGLPAKFPSNDKLHLKGGARENTTLTIVATDAVLTKAQAARLAVMASAGFARAISPVFTPLDGDIVFAAATGRKPLADPVRDLAAIGFAAANCLARAIARGVYEASSLPGGIASWRDQFGS